MPKPRSISSSEEPLDLTIDVCVLISAWEKCSRSGQKKPCKDLTRRIVDCDNHLLALDKKRRILAQYKQKCPKDSLRWLALIASRDKIVWKDPRPLKQATEDKLRKARFGGKEYREDIKYVEVARATECHILVSHDSHFLNGKHVLKAKPIGVYVRSPRGALDFPCP